MENQFDFAAWRQECGISQEQAAEYLGVSLRTVNGLEAGTTPVTGQLELAAQFIANILIWKPLYKWTVMLSHTGARAWNEYLEATFSITAKHTLTLIPTVRKLLPLPPRYRMPDMLVDAARAVSMEMRQDDFHLTQIARVIGHEPPPERLARFKKAGWVTPASMGYSLTGDGRKRVGIRGRVMRAG